MSRLRGARRFSELLDSKATLQVGRAAVHEPGTDNGMLLPSAKACKKAPRCSGWTGCAACMTAEYSSSFKASGVGMDRRLRTGNAHDDASCAATSRGEDRRTLAAPETAVTPRRRSTR